MEEKQKKEEGNYRYELRQEQPPYVSRMEPVTHEAYGGGLYGKDDDERDEEGKKKEIEPREHKPPASETQSADGPDETKTVMPKHKQPPSSGDRDTDITGQSYIQ